MSSPTVWPDNPYIIGRPIRADERELFFGREELFQFIRDNLSKRAKVILLHGWRRIGKSSVLCHVPRSVDLEREFAFVPFDLQDQTRLPLDSVLHTLAGDITDRLDLPRDKVSPSSRSGLKQDPYVFTRDFLPQVYAALGGKNLVLLLDEFDVLGDDGGNVAAGHFFPYLQSILYRQEKLFIIAVMGRRLDEMQNLLSLFSGAPYREIGLLDDSSARRLMTKPTEGVLEYRDDAIQAILELSAGHPYFTQLLCHELFAHARNKQDGRLTRADVESVVDNAILSGESGLIWYRNGLPIPEQVVLSAVAEAQENVQRLVKVTKAGIKVGSFESELIIGGPWKLLNECGVVQTEPLRQAEERLLKWGFLQQVTDFGGSLFGLTAQAYSYKVTIEFVRRWLVRRHPLRNSIAELEQLEAEAQRLYEEATAARQRGERLVALGLYERVLKQNPNHFRALLALAEVCLEVGAFDRAVEFYTRAYQVDPIRTKEGFVRALIGHSHDLIRQGKFEQAKSKLAQAMEVAPGDSQVQKHLQEAEEGMRRTLAAHNPFIVGATVPPDQFVGRRREVDTIFSVIRSRSHVAVFGERRMGKTSLLRYVAAPESWRKYGVDPEQTFIVNLDCQSLVPFSPTRFWREVLLEFREKAEKEAELSSLAADLARAEEISRYDLRKLLQAIEKRGRFLLLLVDEFDVAFQPHDAYTEEHILTFLHELRSLAVHSEEGKAFSSVVATRRRLNELRPNLPTSGSPFYNYYRFLPLRLFNESEMDELLVAKMPEVFALNEAERSWVRQVASGYPYLLQTALYVLFQLHANGQPFEAKRATQEFADVTDIFFSDVWRDASDVERLLFTLIALRNLEGRTGQRLLSGDFDTLLSQRERELLNLEERGLVLHGSPNAAYRYALVSSVMEWWVIKEVETQPGDEWEKQMEMSSDLLSKWQAEQLRDALQQVRQNKVALRAIEAWGQPLKSML